MYFIYSLRFFLKKEKNFLFTICLFTQYSGTQSLMSLSMIFGNLEQCFLNFKTILDNSGSFAFLFSDEQCLFLLPSFFFILLHFFEITISEKKINFLSNIFFLLLHPEILIIDFFSFFAKQ